MLGRPLRARDLLTVFVALPLREQLKVAASYVALNVVGAILNDLLHMVRW